MLTRRMVFSVATVLLIAGSAFGVKPGGGSTTGVVDKVFISNGDGQQILVVDTSTGEAAVILEKEGLFFEGMTFGPDGYLYACAPAQGKIIRFVPSVSPPADPTTVPVEFVYEAGEGDALQNPQCGEFTHNGDLLVTNKDVAVAGGYAVWMFPNDGPFNVPLALLSTPQELVETDSGVGRFEGVTQASNGDLRYVDFTNESVISLSIHVLDLETGVPSFVPVPYIPDLPSLDEPIGIDRSSRDDVFVAENGFLRGYQYDGVDWSTVPCSLELKNERPNFMDFATTQTGAFEDVVFVGTKGKNSGMLHEVVVDSDGACEIATSFSVKKPISNANQIVGVAVPRGDRAGKLVITNPDEPENLFFNLFDHAYRLKPIQGCTVSVTAKDTLPTAICERIRQIEGKGSNPDDPCARYIPCADPPCDSENDIEFDPVIYLGEDNAQMYDIIATGECDPGEYGINHILSSFTQKLRTPRIGFCSYENEEVCLNDWGLSNWNGERCCGLTELNFITPNDGSIPRDGSIGGFGPRLSEWFLVDDQYHIPDYNACMCPVSPLPEDSVPVFSAGSTIPLRVKLLINDGTVPCADLDLEQACQAGSAGDFVTDPDTKVLLSIAYVEGGTFEPVTIEAGGNDQVQPPYFSPPNSVNASSYTYQLKAPAGFTGLYKVVIFVVNRDLEYPQLGFVERYMNIE